MKTVLCICLRQSSFLGCTFHPTIPESSTNCSGSKSEMLLAKVVERFDMPASVITPQLKQYLQLLKLRNFIDPKRHYVKGDSKSKTLSKYVQMGMVVESTLEFILAG
ncbi:hypothetical protein Nepgr_016213 [Nepenthes gracilis]|uniref:Fcf2 pre-rRNA processing C-terminal domain-containing protein n=1 Tax=Nepenthes gracilis TaxID=150966 RepID=A0AAD3SPS4_NEPGR|nr:hypothetical protein Nepgr_016213 [Nepenthes gracilis]